MHEFFFENLRNPARSRRAGLMRQFRSGQLNSSATRTGMESTDVITEFFLAPVHFSMEKSMEKHNLYCILVLHGAEKINICLQTLEVGAAQTTGLLESLKIF
jgi:hypothetical protein